MPKVLILLLLITSIFTSSCLDLNTIHFPGDLLQTRCKDEAVKIENEQGLQNMQPNGKYCLMENLTINEWEEKSWSSDNKFEFDGNNYTIEIEKIEGNAFIKQIGARGTFKNVTLKINKIILNDTHKQIGLLAKGNNGTIKNVTIEGNKDNEIGSSGVVSVGGLVAQNYGKIEDVTLSNIKITGKLHTGGLVGYNTRSIENVTLNNVTVSGSGNIGGLVGYNDVIDNSEGTINDANVSGWITATGAGNIGGLVGYNKGTIEKSHASVDTTIDYIGNQNITAGGFIGGQDERGKTLECSSTGSLTNNTTNKSNLGGFIGKLSGSGSTIEKSFSTTNLTFQTGNIKVGGFIGNQEGGTITNAYSAGKLTSGDYNNPGGGNTTYVGGFIGQQTSGDISYVYTRSKINGNLGVTGPNIKAGHLAGKLNGTIAQAYYRNTNSKQITQAVASTGKNANVREVVQVIVANGEPLNTTWSYLDTNIWNITGGEWPTLRENPE